VRRIAAEMGITLVIVTHDISEAVAIADRAVVMKPDPGGIAEIVPIDIDAADRERRGAGAQAAQSKLQAAFERASGRGKQPSERARPENLKIVATGRR
jgi:ABC-type nitrate/sulfonate/bicarbonate transport system ATPase subunit